MTTDILDRLAAYAPSASSVTHEWGRAEREHCLASVLDDGADGTPARRRLRFVPAGRTGRTRALAPIAASVAVLALAGGVAVLAGRGSGGSGDQAGGDPSGAVTTPTFRATVETPRLGAHQWAYRAQVAYEIRPNAKSKPDPNAAWRNRNGSTTMLDPTASPNCSTFGADGHPSFGNPTQPFVDALPAAPGALRSYLVTHVDGSSSQEEAIFTAVSDVLQQGDLMATSAQRAAMATVLAGLHRAAVHADTDERGRAAIRIDFVDPNQRGGEIQSLYFDHRTFQLIEQRSSTSSAPVPTDGPSAPYSSVPSAHATTASTLPAKASVSVMTAERIVGALPKNCGITR